MEEFRKLMNFILVAITALALKKTAQSDLSTFIPTLSVRHAAQPLYEFWGSAIASSNSPPQIKLSIRRKFSHAAVPLVVNGRCSLAAHNYTLLTTKSFNEWFVDQTQTSLPKSDAPIKQSHRGVVVIFRRHYRITALILSDLVAEGFKAAWDSPTCRRLVDFIIRWGYALAFWLTSIAGPENVYAFEQFRAALLRRHGKRRGQTAAMPAPMALLLMPPAPETRPIQRITRARKSFGQPPTQTGGRLPQACTSELARDLERQLDCALRLEYAPPRLMNIVSERIVAEESQVSFGYITLLEDQTTPERDAATEMRERMREYLPPASDEPAAVAIAKRGKVDVQAARAPKMPTRTVKQPFGQVIKAPQELTEEEKQAQEEEYRRKAILVRTYLHALVPRMPPRSPPVSMSTPYLPRANIDGKQVCAFTMTPRFVDAAPPILLRRGANFLIVIRTADDSQPKQFKGVRQEMKALMLLADCEWAARLVCYCSQRTLVEIKLRYYPPQRSFRSMMKRNGGFLSYRVAVFYLAELIVAVQAFQSYGLIHTDMSICDLTLSPRGDIIIQNFDKSEIYYEGRLPYWIPRHENFFEQKPTGYDEYVRVAHLYFEMLTGLMLDGGVGPHSRVRNQNDSRLQEPRTIDFDFIHFVTGTYPLLPRSSQSIIEHALFNDVDWGAIKNQTAAVPICHNTLQELK